MRKAFLTSSAIAALLLATSFAAAQAPDQKRDEPKTQKSGEPAKPAEHRAAQPEQKGAASQQQPKATAGQAASEPAKHEPKAEQKAEQKADQKNEREAQRKSTEDARKAAEDKRQSEKKSEPTRSNAERSQQEKSKATAAPTQSDQKGASTQDRKKDQPKGAATQPQENKPASAQSSTPSTNSATSTQQPSSSTATNTTNKSTTTTTSSQLAPEKKVRISETITRAKVAPPARNLNISINIGTQVPSRVHFHRLPREVWAIEPRYRDYDYFTTSEEIVIVEPRSHRVVEMIPRDPSRARAQVSTTSTTAGGSNSMAQGSSPNCQVMKRDPSSGQLTEVRPDQMRSTTGSGGSANSLAVTVQAGGGQMPPVSLDGQPGQIVVATQGNGDCQITIEPQPRR